MPHSYFIYLRPPLHILMALLTFVLCTGSMQGQQASEASALQDSVRQMQLQIQQLQAMVMEMREEANRSRAETVELKHELQLALEKLNSQPAAAPNQPSAQGEAGEKSVAERLERLEEDQQLVHGEIEEQHQDKVETVSKYRVKLSGLLLMNVFSNKGNVDSIEVPSVALSAKGLQTDGTPGGSFGATFRQSELGLEIFGPSIAGAKTRGNFVADFFGEFPETVDGSAAGTFRLRTGTVRMDWQNTSVVGGMDNLFFSPTYPTSYASVGIPALSYAGNIWAWMPQLRVEHRIVQSEASTLTISGGIFDPLTGETPQTEFLRIPSAGESSRQPGYAARLEESRKFFGQPLTLGIGGYYNRENWGINHGINGWAGTTDWNVPLGKYLSLSGKFYGGRAIGGLGAGIGRSVVWNGFLNLPGSTVQALPALGGWGQIKIKPASKIEFNIAAGNDSTVAGDVRGFAVAPGYFQPNLTQNRSEFANLIYRPRASLLFSTEFRTLRTFAADGTSERANQLNLVMGLLF